MLSSALLALHPSAPGYLAALVSCLSFGSFSVPMKSEAVRTVDMDPMVFQTYKTALCLITSFGVLGLHRLTFTPWGIVSGLFWVPAGITYYVGVRTAGLAITGAACSSIVVLVSFGWGIFVFQERIRSFTSASLAIGLMIGGICGMSFCTSPTFVDQFFACTRPKSLSLMKSAACEITEDEHSDDSCSVGGELDVEEAEAPLVVVTNTDVTARVFAVNTTSSSSSSNNVTCNNKASSMQKPVDDKYRSKKIPKGGAANNLAGSINKKGSSSLQHPLEIDDKYRAKKIPKGGAHAFVSMLCEYVKRHYDIELSVRQMGLIVASVGAAWGGSVMVPLHFAGEDAKGLRYVFSFAIGASLAQALLWILRYKYHYITVGFDHGTAWQAMPSFHFKEVVLPGALSGLLWSIGNMGSIVSVTYLGEGVGYSLTQSAMLITGGWGIFWFHEITNRTAIHGWLASACLTISGILLLSYNHLPPLPQAVLKG